MYVFYRKATFTYHVHLAHGVDQNDGEDSDGHAQSEALRDVPDDPLEPHGQEEHQDGAHPDEGGEEQEQQDESPRQGSHLERSPQNKQQQGAAHGGGEAQVEVLVVLSLHVALPEPQRHPVYVLRLVAVHRAGIDRLGEEAVDPVGGLVMGGHRVSLPEGPLELVRHL